MENFITVAMLIGIALVIAAMRRGSSVIGLRTGRLQSFSIAGSQDKTMKAILRFAQQSGYAISAMEEDKGQLVLEESASLTSMGFFFPVSVSQESKNKTLIEVGIKSKLFQVGPIVTRSHEKCVNGIKAALFSQK